MTIYECPYDSAPVHVPDDVDVWEAMLGNDQLSIDREKKALIIDAVSGEVTTYAQGRTFALQLAHGLRSPDGANLKRGNVVCIYSPNSTIYPLLCMAAQAAGLVVSLSNPTYNTSEFLHILKDSKVDLVLAASDVLETAEAAARQAGIEKIYILPGIDGKITRGSGSAKSFRTLMKEGRQWKHEPVRGRGLQEVAYLPYSSGTTGLPKGVSVTHRNVVAMSEMLLRIPDFWTKDTVMMSVLPFFHIFALTVNLHHVMRVGGTLAILPRFDLLQFLDGVEKYKCTAASIVPPMALGLARHPAVAKANLSSIKELVCGAAPLSGALQEEVTKRTGVSLHQGFGMSETTSVSTLSRSGKRNKPGAVGLLIPGQQARIVSPDTGEDAEQGEIWIRGPNIVKSYHGNEKATRETFTEDGWLKTGDVGFFDKEGFLTIVDRTKELIKYKGFQVAPAELEALLLECDLVADAAVIGVYSEAEVTELPRAYVVLSAQAKDHKDPQKAIKQFVHDKAAPHKRLRGGVHIIDAIPKSLSGKILRKDLRAMAAKEEKTKSKL